MHFLISSDLLIGDNEIALADFVKRFFQDRIFVEFTDIDKAQQWVDGLGEKQKDQWSRLLQQSVRLKSQHNMKKIYLAANKIRVIPDLGESKWDESVELNLQDAQMVLDHSIMVGLENSRNDQAFLLALLPKKSRERFVNLVEKGRLAFVGGGGNGELKVQLISKAANKTFRLLSWIMFDNDAKFPGDTPQATTELIEVCVANKLNFHCLHRRCVENYITLSIYQLAYPGVAGKKVESIFGLTEEQSKYFNFKKGFSNSKEDEHPVYSSLTPEQKKSLAKGFGDKLASDVYDNEQIRDQIHEIFKASGVIAEFGDKLNHLEQLLGRPV